ncbi:hypothetical protein SAMN05216319_3650 [Duganella sp. CF402]|nr:hypothetical protein EV582_5455 [Duganella sp. BK701]SEM31994.1 hypothetical protein SAMN05216319_3650 [Duganella sp. CF402]
MIDYSILLTLSAETVEALYRQKFKLYIFKAVRCGCTGEVLLWAAFEQYMENNLIEWRAEYAVRVAPAGGVLDHGNLFQAGLGEKVLIQNADGGGSVVRTDFPAGIGIANQTTTPFYTGLAQPAPSWSGACDWNAVAAFTLNGEMEQVVSPAEKVLLAFSTAEWQPGQPVRKLTTPSMLQEISSGGILIDMESGPGTQREVSYVINEGWTWGEQSWGTLVAASDLLAEQLLLPNL